MTLKKLGTLKKGDRFKLDDYECDFVITRPGFGYPDVVFKPVGGNETLTTIKKGWFVEVVEKEKAL